jgi:ATP-dependent Clp protease protease subunit
MNEMLAANCGQPYERVAADTERDNWMSADEAKEYGLIDAVMSRR